MGYGTHPLPVGGVIQVFESLIIQYVIPVTGCATCPLLWVGPMQVFDDNIVIPVMMLLLLYL